MKLRVRLDEIMTACATIRNSFLMTCFIYEKADEWQPLAQRSYDYDTVYAERKPEKRLTNDDQSGFCKMRADGYFSRRPRGT
mgnify:CR=1 FL=1